MIKSKRYISIDWGLQTMRLKNLIIHKFDDYVNYKVSKNLSIKSRSSNVKMNKIKTYAIIAVVCVHCNG